MIGPLFCFKWDDRSVAHQTCEVGLQRNHLFLGDIPRPGLKLGADLFDLPYPNEVRHGIRYCSRPPWSRHDPHHQIEELQFGRYGEIIPTTAGSISYPDGLLGTFRGHLYSYRERLE